MASPTTARRGVLTDLDVNSYVGKVTCTGSKINAGSTEKSQVVADASLQTLFKSSEIPGAVREEAEMGRAKRDLDWLEGSPRTAKRFKTRRGSESHLQLSSRLLDLAQVLLPAELCDGDIRSLSPQSPQNPDLETTSSPLISPTPSFESIDGTLNETLSTLITEPDHSCVARATNHDELRDKAKAIKLRLRLASYKVRTNQIDLPISRLQIKTSLPQLPTIPRVSATAKPSQRRTPLPSVAVSNIPNIRVQKPPSDRGNVQKNVHSSPPPAYGATSSPPTKQVTLASARKDEDSKRDSFATPLVSRQHDGLLNPPNLGSPIWDETRSPGVDLTSSVVKGRAADGLLSLMRQRN